MKLNIALIVVIVAVLVAPGHQANVPAEAPLTSDIKTTLVTVLKLVNKALNSVETYGNDYFLDKLHNYTQIKEWSVNIQNQVTTKVTDILFDLINAYSVYVRASSITPVETKLFSCVINQKSNILAVVKDATTQNGWCNNRLAANLTIAFQKNTATALSINAEFKNYIESLESCAQGDDACLGTFATSAANLIKTQISGKNGTLLAGLKDVYAIYKVMFGEDVPACGKKLFIPPLVEGLRKATNEVVHCAFGV